MFNLTFSHFMLMQTYDNWGIALVGGGASQGNQQPVCRRPGYGLPNLWTASSTGLLDAPTSYPVTFSQLNACSSRVVTLPLAPKNNQSNVIATLYLWKDFDDLLWVTASVNATSSTQYLFALAPTVQPTGDTSAGTFFLNNQFMNSQPFAYSLESLTLLPSQVFSCVTVAINLKSVCDPTYANNQWTGGACQQGRTVDCSGKS